MDRPDETAAHEHSHGALYSYPNRLERQVATYFLKSGGSEWVVDDGPGKGRRIENTRGK
jgi:hypothetical protein